MRRRKPSARSAWQRASSRSSSRSSSLCRINYSMPSKVSPRPRGASVADQRKPGDNFVSRRCTDCAPFLEASLKDSDLLVRANAARALGDLRIRDASLPLLAMFAAEQEQPAIQQATLAIRMLGLKAAAPSTREKISVFTGQTRAWLIQALGVAGDISDVPLIAKYMDASDTEMASLAAIQDLAGVNFGPAHMVGLSTYPPPELLAARAWWKSHKDEWPRCDDCRPK
jgi:hypothetical protein